MNPLTPIRSGRWTATLVALAVTAAAALVGLAPAGPAAAAACTPTSESPTVTLTDTTASLGGKLRFTGTGWCNPDDGGSRIAVKLDDGAYSHLDATVHANLTVWAIVDAAAADGTFSASITLPDGTTKTSTPAFPTGAHTLRLLTGSLKDGDPVRTVQSAAFTVSKPSTPVAAGCEPTTPDATVSLGSTKVAMGGKLKITGTGWCHPTTGGSRIAIKLDDGAYSHVDDSVHPNLTVWAIVDADPEDGTFAATVKLPDGTTKTSTPAFPKGSHTLRLLTGSLKDGDPVRTVQSDPFTVGAYRPNGTPDPINAKKLRKANRHGVTATKKGKKLTVKAPQTKVGSWVYVSLYAKDGSPRYPWPSWQRLGKGHKVTLSLKGKGLTGKARLVVQSGDAGRVGKLLGWTKVKFGKAKTTPGCVGSCGKPPAPAVPGSTTPTDDSVTTSATPASPEPPLASYDALDPGDHGSVKSRLADGVLTVKVGDAAAGSLVYLYVYTPTDTLPVGWATVDDKHTVTLDLSGLGGSYAGVTVQDSAGALLGWTPVALPATASTVGDTATVATSVAPTAAASSVASTDQRVWVGTTDGLLLATGALLLVAAALLTNGRRGGSLARHAVPAR